MDQDLEDDQDLINSFEKWIRQQGLVDWPVVYGEHLELPTNFGFSSSRQTFDHLKVKVPFPEDIPISISKSIETFWSKVKPHESTMSQAQSIVADTISDANKYTMYVEKARRIMKEQSVTVSRSLDISDYDYPGFDKVEVTDIPGHPDALQHLDHVSEAQSFNPGFLKIWRPFFISDLSVAVLKDTFWWFFLHTFKPNVEEEERLFDRIAGVFVCLLMKVQMHLKDKLFKVYADCLAQAVYTAFYGAFTESVERLDDNFKRDLADMITLWVSGVKPRLFSWQSWNLDWLSPLGDAVGESGRDSMCDLQLEFLELLSDARRLTLTLTTPLSPAAKGAGNAGADVRKRENVLFSPRCQSHYVRAGPEFRHVHFKPCGQSPLVLRYLQIHAIPVPAGSSTRAVRRTEVSYPPPSEPARREEEEEEESDKRQRAQRHASCQRPKHEIAEIHRERVYNNQELSRMKTEPSSNPVGLKFASEGIIMNKWDNPLYRQRLPKGEGRGREAAEAKYAGQSSYASENGESAGQ